MFNRIARLILPAAFVLGTLAPVAMAGAFPGPKETKTSVRAFDKDQFRPILFNGGELAIVTLRGDGDTDLDLYIYDGDGNLVAKDDDGTDRCVAAWVPTRTGYFTIVVKNRGRVYNEYTMVTN